MAFNYFINGFLTVFPSFGVDVTPALKLPTGLTRIAGVITLDTSIIGSILIASIAVWIHNKYFDKKLPELLGIFQRYYICYYYWFLINDSYGILNSIIMA